MIAEETGLTFNKTIYHVRDGYFYLKKTTTVNRVQLRCAIRKSCPGRASIPIDPLARQVHTFRDVRAHDHAQQPEWIEVELLKKRILHRCTTESTLLRTIYNEEIARVGVDVMAALPYYPFSEQMSKARRKVHGLIPATLMEYGTVLEDSQRYGRTITGGQFYRATLMDDNGDTAVVFVSPTIEERLSAACTHAHVDATFKVTPPLPECHQLLTLSVIYFDHAFPLVTSLMSRKTEVLYKLLFTFIAANLFPNWAPLVMTTDFESALQNSLRLTWRGAHIVGCWFHSANCMNKKVRKLGHVRLLRENAFARKAVKMCQVLPLLPVHLMNAGYDSIVDFANRHNVLMPLVTFLNYVFRVWITGVGAESMSVYKQRRRTNNDMESYHRKLRDVMGRAHPNIWVFTDGLRTLEHSATATLLALVRAHNALRRTRPNYLLSNRTIVRLTDLLDSGRYNVGEFLEAASHQIENVHNQLYNQVIDADSEDEDFDGLIPGWLPPDNEQPAAPRVVARGRGAVRGHRERRGARARGRGRGVAAAAVQGRGARPRARRCVAGAAGRGCGRRGGVVQHPQMAEHGALLAIAHAITAAGPNPALLEALRAAAVVALAPPQPALAPEPDPDNPPAGLDYGFAAPVADAAPEAVHPDIDPAVMNPVAAHAPPHGIVLNPCLICLEHRRDMMVAIGCGHVAVCEECSTQLFDQRCVACRRPMIALHRIAIMN